MLQLIGASSRNELTKKEATDELSKMPGKHGYRALRGHKGRYRAYLLSRIPMRNLWGNSRSGHYGQSTESSSHARPESEADGLLQSLMPVLQITALHSAEGIDWCKTGIF